MKISSVGRLNKSGICGVQFLYRYAFKFWLLIFSLLVVSCSGDSDSGDGSGNSTDSYVEFDITVNGVSYTYFNDADDLRAGGDGASMFVMFGNGLDPTWPDDRLTLLLRFDIVNFTDTSTIAENMTFDMSQDYSNILEIMSTVLSPNNTRPDNLQRRDYISYPTGFSGLNSGTITLVKFILPNSGDSTSDVYRNNIQFDMKLDNVVLNTYTNMSGTGSFSFPINITINHARFCKLASGCQNKMQATSYVGQYTGGPVTVISSNCLDSNDDGPFTFNNSALSVTEHAWGNFKATATFSDVVGVFSVVSTEVITGTISNNELNGVIEDTFTIDQVLASSGTGTVTGTIAGNNINLSFMGQDTSGDTCSWTADASFTRN